MKLPETLKTRLFSIAHQIENKTVGDLEVSQASLDGLTKMLSPSEIKDNPNFSYYAGDLAVGAIINKNDDGITIEDAVKIYKNFEGTPIDVEHVVSKVVGYILKANLTDPETKEILTDEQALSAGKPINISIAFVIWPRTDESLSGILEEVGDEENPAHGLISLSWELAFDEYVLLTGSRNVFEGQIINDDNEIMKIEDNLRCNGGSGLLADGKTPVYRLVTGDNLLPLGAGLVVKPAAEVKGVVKIDLEEEEEDETNDTEENETQANKNFLIEQSNNSAIDLLKQVDEELKQKVIDLSNSVASLTQNLEKSSLSNNDTVKLHRMKIKNISDINDETLKVVEASEVTRFIASELEAKADEHQKAIKAKEAEALAAKTAADEAIAKSEEAAKQIEVLTSELNEIKAARLAEKATNDFNVRMAALDEEFELSDEDRKVVAGQINSLDEESFASWKTAFDVIAKEKCKAVIKTKKEEAEKLMEEEKKKKAQASVEDPLQTVVASEKEVIPASMTFGEDAIASYREAFAINKGVTFVK